jgi:hypothetical protein
MEDADVRGVEVRGVANELAFGASIKAFVRISRCTLAHGSFAALALGAMNIAATTAQRATSVTSAATARRIRDERPCAEVARA